MANQALRQEINLLCASLSSTGTLTINEIAQLDTTQYSGTPTYWFEAVYSGAASNTGTIKLRDIAAATNVASLAGATSGSNIISRVQFTPTAGARAYTVQLVGDGTRSQIILDARIIILQSEALITQTETQIEIGNETVNLSNTVVADITAPKYWKYTAANWDGTKTFSVEVVYKTSAANTATITLCRTSDNTSNVTVASASHTSYTRVRVTFTPVDGETYKLRGLSSSSKSSYTIACAKIVVDQTNAIDGQILGLTGGGNPINGGTAGSSQTSQACGQSFTASATYNTSLIKLMMYKIGAPTDNLTLEVLTTSITGSVIATSSGFDSSTLGTSTTGAWVSFIFGSFALTSGTKYYLRLTRVAAFDATNAAEWINPGINAYTGGGGAYVRTNNVWGAESTTTDFTFQVIGDTTTAISKLEPQFLVLNTSLTGPGSTNTPSQTWNSSEWNAGSGTITYIHAMDSAVSSSAKLEDVSAGNADIANSTTATGTIQQVSSAMTFTNAHNIDVNVISSTAVVASRILVDYVFVASAAVDIPDLITEPMTPSRWN